MWRERKWRENRVPNAWRISTYQLCCTLIAWIQLNTANSMENLFNKWHAFRSHFAKFHLAHAEFELDSNGMYAGRYADVYLWNSAWFLFQESVYDKDNSNITFQTTSTEKEQQQTQIVHCKMVIQWFRDIRTSFDMNRKKFCFVMTKILCAVNTNFSILVSSLYCAYVHKDSPIFLRLLVHFYSLSMWVWVARRHRMPFQKASCMPLPRAFRTLLYANCSAFRIFSSFIHLYVVHSCTACCDVLPFTFFYLLVYVFCLYLYLYLRVLISPIPYKSASLLLRSAIDIFSVWCVFSLIDFK